MTTTNGRPTVPIDELDDLDIPLDVEVELPDVVNLGSIAEVQSGESLALKHTGDDHTADNTFAPDTDEELGPFQRFIREVKDYRLLKNTPYGLKPALVIGFLTFFGRFDAQAFRIAGPEIARDLEINVGDIINIQVLIGMVGVFATIAVGYAADRTKRIPYVGIGATVGGLFSMLGGRAGSFATLAGPRVASDVADEASNVPRFSLLADYYPIASRGRVFALLGTLSRIAGLLSVFIVGFLVTSIGWKPTFILTGLPVAIMGVVSLLLLREPVRGYFERKAMGADESSAVLQDEPQSLAESWRTTFGVRTIKRLVMASAVGGVGEAMVALFYPFFLADIYGLSAWERSLVTIPSILVGLVGGIYGGGLIDRFTRRNPSQVLTLLAVYALVASLGVLIYAVRPPIPLLVVANAIFAFGAALIGPARNVVYANVIPASIRTTGLQVAGLASLPALILAGSVGGTLLGTYGYNAIFFVAFPFLVVDGLIALTAAPFYDLDMRSATAASMAEQEWRRAKEEGRGKLLVCRDIDVEYNGVQVLFGVDFDVEEGEIIALLGTNGAGKSTLLRAISGTQPAVGGAVVFDGRDVTHMPPHEITARGIVHMPGGRGVFPGLSVRDNLMLANWLNDDPESVRDKLTEVLEIFPRLRERIDVDAGALSGGEQQQLSLAQAFLVNPRLLCIDELSLGLAPTVVAELLDIVREIHRRGVTIVVVEQSVNVALTIAKKAIFMEKGEVRFFGPTEELVNRPDILRAVYVKGSGSLSSGGPKGAARSVRERRSLELEQSRPVLEVEGLTKRYGGVTAVNDVSFELRDGEVLGLIGPNGAGKTSIFDLVSGFQIADAGAVRFLGADVTLQSPEQRARQGLIRRFQDAALFGSLTVFETLLVSLEQHIEVRSTLMNAASLPQARKAERRLRVRAERLIDLLELGSYRDKFVKELSTGLRRVVDLACVLASEPKVLLLDEPSSGIAQAEAESLGPLLRRAQHETGCSILIIEHDMPLISAVSDELLALVQGSVLMRGRPEEVLEDERVIEAYLGRTEATIKRSGSTTP